MIFFSYKELIIQPLQELIKELIVLDSMFYYGSLQFQFQIAISICSINNPLETYNTYLVMMFCYSRYRYG